MKEKDKGHTTEITEMEKKNRALTAEVHELKQSLKKCLGAEEETKKVFTWGQQNPRVVDGKKQQKKSQSSTYGLRYIPRVLTASEPVRLHCANCPNFAAMDGLCTACALHDYSSADKD